MKIHIILTIPLYMIVKYCYITIQVLLLMPISHYIFITMYLLE